MEIKFQHAEAPRPCVSRDSNRTVFELTKTMSPVRLNAVIPCLVVAFSLICSATVFADEPVATLHWKNKDKLLGWPVAATGSEIQWKSDAFKSPITISKTALAAIEFPAAPKNSSVDSQGYFVRLLNGDHIFGDIKSIDSDSVTMLTPHHGTLKISRDSVASVQRLNVSLGGGINLADLKDWRSANRTLKRWALNAAGKVSTSTANATLCRSSELPDVVTVDLQLASEPQLKLPNQI